MNIEKIAIGRLDDLPNHEMTRVEKKNVPILLIRNDDQVEAIGGLCPHFGAPLETGLLFKEHVVCPWHHARFSITTGDLLDPPAYDGIPSYKVTIEDGIVYIFLPEKPSVKETPPMVKPDLALDHRHFVIAGAGAAGFVAAETLRQAGYRGRITMITREKSPPYDRTSLSKGFLNDNSEKPILRNPDFFKKYDIHLIYGEQITEIIPSKRTVNLAGGQTVKYDKVLLATGGRPNTLNIKGKDLSGIFTLRSISDAEGITEYSENKGKITIIGSGFIGLECASSMISKGLNVSVITRESVPFAKKFGEDIGRMFKSIHEQNGVEFICSESIKEFHGTDAVESIVLSDGTVHETNLVIQGIGVTPVTDYLCEIAINDDCSLNVNKYFQIEGFERSMYAAGDIATFPDPLTSQPVRIEHWRTAMQHGRVAALNMSGIETPFNLVPFFWTRQHGMGFTVVGHPVNWTDIHIDGSIDERKFLAYYIRDDRIIAVGGSGMGREMAAIEELMRTNQLPDPDKIINHDIDWIALAK